MNKLQKFDTSTVVWLALILSTLISWLIGGDTTHSAQTSSIIVLAVAFFKVRLVGIHFMELSHAPLPMRIVFETWVILVGSGLIAAYLWQ